MKKSGRHVVHTIGHSTRTLEELVAVLDHHDVEMLADIRHFPRSRRNPQFNKEILEKELPKNRIDYEWIEKLGGFRRGGYKKYTKTRDFAAGLGKLVKLAKSKRTAILCAEILWMKCHRKYVADELKRRKFRVVHVYDAERAEKHLITRPKKKIKCDLNKLSVS